MNYVKGGWNLEKETGLNRMIMVDTVVSYANIHCELDKDKNDFKHNPFGWKQLTGQLNAYMAKYHNSIGHCGKIIESTALNRRMMISHLFDAFCVARG